MSVSLFAVTESHPVEFASPDQRLTPYQRAVIHIIANTSSTPQAVVASMYGVSQQTVSRIKSGRWFSGSRIAGVTA